MGLGKSNVDWILKTTKELGIRVEPCGLKALRKVAVKWGFVSDERAKVMGLRVKDPENGIASTIYLPRRKATKSWEWTLLHELGHALRRVDSPELNVLEEEMVAEIFAHEVHDWWGLTREKRLRDRLLNNQLMYPELNWDPCKCVKDARNRLQLITDLVA